MRAKKPSFDFLCKRYDWINQILSFGMDRSWRRRAASYLPKHASLKLLDVASGTGEQLIACFESGASIESAIGIDLANGMLSIASQKICTKKYCNQISLQCADMEALPFDDRFFDIVTCSFGIRNATNPSKAMQEVYRVLKPGGRCIFLEFSLPPPPLRKVHHFYLRSLLPRIGGILSKNQSAYSYLGQTIEEFPFGQAFCSLLRQAHFCLVQHIFLSLGAVTIYLGEKQV